MAGRTIREVKWVQHDLLVLLTSHQKLIFYDAVKVQNVSTLRPCKDLLVCHKLQVVPQPKANLLYLLGCSSSRLSILIVACKEGSLQTQARLTFSLNEPLSQVFFTLPPPQIQG